MMNSAETWAVDKAQETKLGAAEMRMYATWMSGVTKLDSIRNEIIRGTTKVGEISKKVQESRLKLYHASRREEEYVGMAPQPQRCQGKEGEEDQSGGGWITSRTICRRGYCQRR